MAKLLRIEVRCCGDFKIVAVCDKHAREIERSILWETWITCATCGRKWAAGQVWTLIGDA